MVAKKKPSAAQLAARAKFVKMVRAKAAKSKAAKKVATKKVGAYKKPKLFKPTKKQTAAAVKRLVEQTTKKPSTHKDTKSHNVNIRVLSGIGNINKDMLLIRATIEKDIKNTLGIISAMNEQKKRKEKIDSQLYGRLKKRVPYLKKQLRLQNSLIAKNLV